MEVRRDQPLATTSAPPGAAVEAVGQLGLGEQLRRARLQQGLSLAQVEQATHIRQRYLLALERDDWAACPGQFYARAFFRTYARFLGLKVEAGMAAGEPTGKPGKGSGTAPADARRARFRPQHRGHGRRQARPTRRRVWTLLALLLALALVGAGMGWAWWSWH